MARVLGGWFPGQSVSQINSLGFMLLLWKMSATEVCSLWGCWHCGDHCGYVSAWALHKWKVRWKSLFSQFSDINQALRRRLPIWPTLVMSVHAKLNINHMKWHHFQKIKQIFGLCPCNNEHFIVILDPLDFLMPLYNWLLHNLSALRICTLMMIKIHEKILS